MNYDKEKEISAEERWWTKIKPSWEPAKDDSVEFGPNHLHELRVQEVLTQTEGTPVTGTHAAQTRMAANTHTKIQANSKNESLRNRI